MKALSSACGAVEEQRNERGQWRAGVSGNRSGRPRKKSTGPKGLADHLADAMMEEIPLVTGEGKQEMVPAYEAVARQLVRSFPTLKSRELIAAMRWMDNLKVFDEMRRRAGNCPEVLTLEQMRERLKAKLAELREKYPAQE